MPHLKNMAVGFLVSCIGSIPLGYLNVVGFQVFQQLGGTATAGYLLGVVLIEALVIYVTLVFAQPLATNTKLSRFIEVFGILFMFLLAGVFYGSPVSETRYATALAYTPFVLGVVLSCFNVLQIPFWTGWNLYLINEHYIDVAGPRKFSYLLGTFAGTFFGMALLIFSLSFFAAKVALLSHYLMQGIMPLVFLAMGLWQLRKFYRKHYRVQ